MRPSPSHVLIFIRFTLARHSTTPLNSPFLLGNLATDGEVLGDASGQQRSPGGVARTGVAPVPFGDRVRHVGVAHVVSPFGAECCVRRRVGPGFGEDVAAVAERVGPGPEAEGLVLGEAAETPAGAHEGADVFAHGCRFDVAPGGERVVCAGACLARALRDVLGHVGGDRVVVGSVTIDVEWTGVDLCAPAEGQLTHGRAVGRADQDPSGGGAHGLDEQFRSAPGRGFVI